MHWLVIINLPCLFLILRGFRQIKLRLNHQRSIFLGGILFLLLASFLFFRWIENPLSRTFSWHALMHSDIVYALVRGELIPEEPELAGLHLAYGWIPHIFLAWWDGYQVGHQH